MPFNLLLFPLLGGYIFVQRCNLTRYKALRYDGQRLVFAASLAGVCFLISAFGIGKLLNFVFPFLKTIYHSTVALPFDYAPAAIGSFLLGCLLWIPINVFYSEGKAIRRAIKQNNDPMELLFLRSLDESRQVLMTLKNNKVYIGWITEAPNPVLVKHITIVPTESGFRDTNTKQLTITTRYWQVYQKIQTEQLLDISQQDFTMVIPVTEILSISIYNPDHVFQQYIHTSESR